MPEGKRTDSSLREKERKVQSLQMQGITGSKLTVLELVERYLSLKTGVKHNTLANYNFVVNVLKKEEFSHKKVDDVKLSDAKIFLIKLQRDGRGYSSIHSIRGVLRPAFQMAVDDDLILKNPFGFELGTILVNDSQKREAVSLEDEARSLEFVKNDPHYNRYYDAFYILFKTGLRISEFCGLIVRDLDFKNEVIRIDHQLQRTRDMKYVIEKQIGYDLDSQMHPEGRSMTVEELVERYLSTRIGVKPNTKANYNFVKNLMKKEDFYYKKIGDVKTSDAKLFLIKLQQDGKRYSTVKTVRGVLRPVFQMAVDDDVLYKNPFGFELAGVVVNDSVTREALTRDQML